MTLGMCILLVGGRFRENKEAATKNVAWLMGLQLQFDLLLHCPCRNTS